MNLLKNFRHKDFRINSVDLCEIVNKFRELEGNKTKKRHYDFYIKITKEINDLKKCGIDVIGERKISLSYYVTSQDKEMPCYEMSGTFALEMLNSESAFVRYKTQEYIEELENKLLNSELSRERNVSRITHRELHMLVGDDKKCIGLDVEIYQLVSYNLNLPYIYRKEEMYKRDKTNIAFYDKILSFAYDLIERFKRQSKDGHFIASVISELKYEFAKDIEGYINYLTTHEVRDYEVVGCRGFGR